MDRTGEADWPVMLVKVNVSTANDYVKINQALSGHLIDLGAGTDETVMLGLRKAVPTTNKSQSS